MKLTLAFIAQRARSELFDAALHEYLGRLRIYATVETAAFRTEESFLKSVSRQRTQASFPWLTLLDRRGQALSSEDFAAWLLVRRDSGRQAVLFAVGPADGWSEQARRQAQTLLSLGRMTLPHELARVVLAEQIYRAFTILAGRPYHTGH